MNGNIKRVFPCHCVTASAVKWPLDCLEQSKRSCRHPASAAYCPSLRSACLSRQVGAAMSDLNGNVISTGCNPVPINGVTTS